MKLVWDESKRRVNIDKHGLDFASLDLEFFAASVIYPAKLGRFMAVGWLQDMVIAVVFMPLGHEGVSLISMRPASQKERK